VTREPPTGFILGGKDVLEDTLFRYTMRYRWDPDATFRISDDFYAVEMLCLGRKSYSVTRRCTVELSPAAVRRARDLLFSFSTQTPDMVDSDQLLSLAQACLCHKHRHDVLFTRLHLQNRLDVAKQSYFFYKNIWDDLNHTCDGLRYALGVPKDSGMDDVFETLLEKLAESEKRQDEFDFMSNMLSEARANVDQMKRKISDVEKGLVKQAQAAMELQTEFENLICLNKELHEEVKEYKMRNRRLRRSLNDTLQSEAGLKVEIFKLQGPTPSQAQLEKQLRQAQEREVEELICDRIKEELSFEGSDDGHYEIKDEEGQSPKRVPKAEEEVRKRDEDDSKDGEEDREERKDRGEPSNEGYALDNETMIRGQKDRSGETHNDEEGSEDDHNQVAEEVVDKGSEDENEDKDGGEEGAKKGGREEGREKKRC